jgi:hypothetical protein
MKGASTYLYAKPTLLDAHIHDDVEGGLCANRRRPRPGPRLERRSPKPYLIVLLTMLDTALLPPALL